MAQLILFNYLFLQEAEAFSEANQLEVSSGGQYGHEFAVLLHVNRSDMVHLW